VPTKTPTNKSWGSRKPEQHFLPFKGKLSRLLEEKAHQPLREEIANLLKEEGSGGVVYSLDRPPEREIYQPTKEEVQGLIGNPSFTSYKETFGLAHSGRHTRKRIGGTWFSVSGPVPTSLLYKTLVTGEESAGVLSRWYPKYMIIDFDDVPLSRVEEIRKFCQLDDTNSAIHPSESKDSYHVIVSVMHRHKPITYAYLKMVTQRFVARYGVEIYPQERRTIRLPFGPSRPILGREELAEWYEKLESFLQLEPYDVGWIPRSQGVLDLSIPTGEVTLMSPRTASDLWQEGLQRPRTRHISQLTLLNWFHRMNEHKKKAIKQVWWWVQHKHNGHSRKVNKGAWDLIWAEILRQADYIYEGRHQQGIWPDEIHNSTVGFVTKPDIVEIIKRCKGRHREMKFFYKVVQYHNPRRHRSFVNIHTDLLREWGGSYYREYLKRWESGRYLKRGHYKPGEFARSIVLQGWNPQSRETAVKWGERSIVGFDEGVRITFEPWEFRSLLESVGVERTTRHKMVNRLFEEGVAGVLDMGKIKVRIEK
jgi:hypothetical protein